ncbi:hypothetical protein E5P55_00310 [Candidatus Pinguicoccus supinus]|uniref:Uncharacterized protein n=1 Tax=Candidatus Pinguicoccus supinus TaxID=2529394 RepID=A0A7T0BRJ4_9BACT|nr:hypothetical protein E5P55_00310 [Candidatus Pinguicoccus supinus]
MSKSLNNTISMVDLMCSKFNLLNIKLFFLTSSYAKKQNF